MIRHIENTEIDYDKWDQCIKESFNGNVYAMSWYLDLVFSGWSALVDDDYNRVMPLPISQKWGIRYMYQPFFVQQLGVFSKTVLNPSVVSEFVDAIPEKVKVARYNFNVFNRFEKGKFKVKPNVNYELDLIGDYRKLHSGYNTNQKRNIKKAVKNNFVFTKGISPGDIIDLFRNNRGVDVQHWGDAQYITLQRLMYSAIHKGKGVAYGLYNDKNELYAAAFFMLYNKKMIFMFSGTSSHARNTGAMSYLIDQVIQTNSSSGWIMDFEGSNNENLARFYKGFGAKKTYYYTLEINRLSLITKLLFSIYRFVFSKEK